MRSYFDLFYSSPTAQQEQLFVSEDAVSALEQVRSAALTEDRVDSRYLRELQDKHADPALLSYLAERLEDARLIHREIEALLEQTRRSMETNYVSGRH